MPPLRTLSFLALAAATGLTFTGCRSMTESTEHVTEAADRPAMTGEALFQGGKVRAELALGHGFYKRLKRGALEGRDDYNPFAPVDEESKKEERYQSIADSEELFVPRMHNSVLPPYALRLRVTNLSDAAIDVVYVECASALGNFAIRPETAKIEAGQTHSPNPMITLLGVSGEDITVKVTLALNGTSESQTLTLKTVPNPPPPPGPPGGRPPRR